MNFNGWDLIAKHDLEFVADKILTNRQIKDFQEDTAYFKLISEDNNPLTILDFGCGIGRNTFGFSLHYPTWKFVGYDNENMINRCFEYAKIKYPQIESFPSVSFYFNWDEVKLQRFDVIFCHLVLQHVHEKDLRIYLSDFRNMTQKLVVHGRRFNDDEGKNTWKILEKYGYYPSSCTAPRGYVVDGYPEEHFTCVYRW